MVQKVLLSFAISLRMPFLFALSFPRLHVTRMSPARSPAQTLPLYCYIDLFCPTPSVLPIQFLHHLRSTSRV
jgi:hypothetical protein